MFSLQRIVLRYMQTSGFSIGLEDIWESQAFRALKEQYVRACFGKLGYDHLNLVEQSWRYPSFKTLIDAGKDELQKVEHPETNEGTISGMLSDLRTRLSEDIVNYIYGYRNINHNSTLIMSRSGSKGSIIN